jgi:hypothetical protein
MRRTSRSLCFLSCFALAVSALSAQEGHPLVGSWHGNWSLNGADRKDLTLIVDYTPDGAGITGLVNPGYDQATIQNVVLTIAKPTDWNFKFEVDLKDKSGKTTRYVADGKLDQIGYDQRTLKGTWTAGTTKGDFKLTRDRDYTR